MPKPLITINSFEAGIILDPTLPAANGFSFGEGVDIYSEPGYLKLSPSLSQMTEATAPFDIKQPISWFVKYKGPDNLGKVLAYGVGGGTLYAYNWTVANSWSAIHLLSTTNISSTQLGGLAEFNDEMFYSVDASLGRMSYTTLNGGMTDVTASIVLASNSNLGSPGSLIIDSENIRYNNLYGSTGVNVVQRGARGSTAAAHNDAARVYGFNDNYKIFARRDTLCHPMVVSDVGKLTIGDGRNIADLDTDGNFRDNALVLPSSERIRCLTRFSERIVAGTTKGNNLASDYPEGMLWIWDMTSTDPEQAFTLQENGVYALYSWRSVLMVFAGLAGNVYQFNGAAVQKVFQLPKQVHPANYGIVYPGAVSEFLGNLIFGYSAVAVGNEPDYSGIYALGSPEIGKPLALTAPYVLSPNKGTALAVFSLLPTDRKAFYTSWQNITAITSVGVDELLPAGISNGYIETQKYEIAVKNKPRLLKGVEIIAESLSASIGIKYKLDGATAYSSLDTIWAGNQADVLLGIAQRAKVIQLRFDMPNATLTATQNPKIQTIKIY